MRYGLRPLPPHELDFHPAAQRMRHPDERPNRQIARLILHRRNLRRAHLAGSAKLLQLPGRGLLSSPLNRPRLPHERQSPDTHRFLRDRDHCPVSQIFFANLQHVLK